MAARWKRRNKPKERKQPRIEVIYGLQGGLCYLCSKGIPHPRSDWVHHSDRASLDHVTPKNHDDPSKACKHIRRNGLVAHHGCNNKKGNRSPYACELLFLAAVNERLAALKQRTRHY